MSKKVMITGSTGMVGKGVLLACLDDENISEILLINRTPIKINHPKLKEIIHEDFLNFGNIEDKLKIYDGCFHCMGVSVSGMSEEKYNKLTFEITAALVDTLFDVNPNMVFNYVSGTNTDSTERGNTMWARIKGKTENYILSKGFYDAYMFRPGLIIPENGIKSKTKLYAFLYFITKPFYGLMKKSKNITTTSKVGLAMISSLSNKQTLKHLENKDINELAMK